MIQVAPGIYAEKPCRLGDVRVQRLRLCEDGQRRWIDLDRWFRFRQDEIDRLQLGINWQAMRRLCRAGFVEMQRPAPSSFVWSLDSYLAHCDRVEATYADGVVFWTPDRTRAYMDALMTNFDDRDTSLTARKRVARAGRG